MGSIFEQVDDFAKDPREKRICLKQGIVWEEDNRVVPVYHWNSVTLNTCGTDALKWNQPPLVRVEGGIGGGGGDTGSTTSTPYYIVFRQTTAEFSIDGDNVVSGKGEAKYITNIPAMSAEREELEKQYANGEISDAEYKAKVAEYNAANAFVVSFLVPSGKTLSVIDAPTSLPLDGLEKLTEPFTINGEAWDIYEWDGPGNAGIHPGDDNYEFKISVK